MASRSRSNGIKPKSSQEKDATAPNPEKWQLYMYLLPVFGAIPAVLTLTKRNHSATVHHTCQTAVMLMILWAVGYGAMGGVPLNGDLLNPQTALIQGSFSTVYFLTCLYLMVRVWRNQPIHLPWHKSERSPKP